MDALPLPPRPNLDQYKKRAKELVSAAQSGDANAIRAWAADWLTALSQVLDASKTPNYDSLLKQAIDRLIERVEQRMKTSKGQFALADAQHLIATIHSFENWAAFARHIEAPFSGDTRVREFESRLYRYPAIDPPSFRKAVMHRTLGFAALALIWG